MQKLKRSFDLGGKKIITFLSRKTFVIVILVAVAIITTGLIYLKIKGSQGCSIGLSQGFPSIPIYPNASLIKSSSDPHEGETYIGVKFSATWSSKNKVSDISKWYIQKLEGSGWTLDVAPGNPNANDIQLATFFNNNYSLNMSFVRDLNSNLTNITAEFSTRYSDTKEPGENESK